MTIQLTLLKNVGFVHQPATLTTPSIAFFAAPPTSQNQTFKSFEVQNGYGAVTQVSVTPGYGATVTASVNMVVTSITEQTFQQVIHTVKNSYSYQNNSDFKQQMDGASYSSAGSTCSGIFGWLVGNHQDSYSNTKTDLTNQINSYNSGNSSDDHTVANTVANILLNNTSTVSVTASISVTGQLLVPSPTIIAVETSTFTFTKNDGTTSSVSILNQTPVVPADSNNGTVSQNTVAPGSKLTIVPVGS